MDTALNIISNARPWLTVGKAKALGGVLDRLAPRWRLLVERKRAARELRPRRSVKSGILFLRSELFPKGCFWILLIILFMPKHIMYRHFHRYIADVNHWTITGS